MKAASWRIKVWQISSIRQIHHTKVTPKFCRLWHVIILATVYLV